MVILYASKWLVMSIRNPFLEERLQFQHLRNKRHVIPPPQLAWLDSLILGWASLPLSSNIQEFQIWNLGMSKAVFCHHSFLLHFKKMSFLCPVEVWFHHIQVTTPTNPGPPGVHCALPRNILALPRIFGLRSHRILLFGDSGGKHIEYPSLVFRKGWPSKFHEFYNPSYLDRKHVSYVFIFLFPFFLCIWLFSQPMNIQFCWNIFFKKAQRWHR